ncbi:MAG TPA: adenosine kinase [Bacteroidales bacterium]|jgi:sugar/nucleoside kinase (ribokinase family)|nr:adenosine kinase [Bacteroidales bacterium]HPT08828.1 adenosine kinase [Bacteroidales bacterium]
MKKILGMGNALVDIMITLESDTILQMLDLPKGSMQLVDEVRSNAVLEALKSYDKRQSAGGSAANTLHGLAMLGMPSGYIGVVGEDALGGVFVRDMIRAGVEPHLVHSTTETGRAIALVTPDSERTFATFLGAAIELTAAHLEPGVLRSGDSVFDGYSLFHVEGYLVQNHELIRKAVEMAKFHGLKVSLDLASYNVVEDNREFLQEIITRYVDILFANEEEARAMTGMGPADATRELGKFTEIAVVKTGSNGSLVRTVTECCEIGIIPVKPVDTTGAGDLYAAGFLFGHSMGLPMQRCGELGALLAGNVIEFIGSKMSNDRWQQIKNQIER